MSILAFKHDMERFLMFIRHIFSKYSEINVILTWSGFSKDIMEGELILVHI